MTSNPLLNNTEPRQDELLNFVNDPNTIHKAVNGSMEKRSKLMHDHQDEEHTHVYRRGIDAKGEYRICECGDKYYLVTSEDDEPRKQIYSILSRLNEGGYVGWGGVEQAEREIYMIIADRERQARESANQRIVNDLELIRELVISTSISPGELEKYIADRIVTLTNQKDNEEK